MTAKKITVSLMILLSVLLSASFADEYDSILKQWTKETKAAVKEGDQDITIKITYFSNEYIEALITAEAERNLWTADEMENYKYTLLKNLNLAETIPFHVDLYVRGTPVYAQPFEKHITMMIGGKKYAPIDYDRRFNFKILGPRDGMVYFPRYDEKTGKEILSGAKDVRVIFDGSISHALSGKPDVVWIWDLTKDRAKIAGGRAADRLEADRLIKRSQKIDEERAELQKKLDELNKEYRDVNSRIDELQSN